MVVDFDQCRFELEPVSAGFTFVAFGRRCCVCGSMIGFIISQSSTELTEFSVCFSVNVACIASHTTTNSQHAVATIQPTPDTRSLITASSDSQSVRDEDSPRVSFKIIATLACSPVP